MIFRRFTIIILTLLSVLVNAQIEFVSSGDLEIDSLRQRVLKDPSNQYNYEERALLMYLWMGSLQEQGADVSRFWEIDQKFHKLVGYNRSKIDEQVLLEIGQVVDRGYEKLEKIQHHLFQYGTIFTPYDSEGKDFPEDGDLEANWPMFQANKYNNGYTEASGPRYGRNVWKFPIGLGWYSRPVLEGNRVYLSSPGMRTTSFCLDLNSGREIWKSTQHHPIFGTYKYPAIMSTPVIQDDKIILREVNSHGGNQGQAKHLVYIDKRTGKTLNRSYAGHVDYRTRYAPVASNDNYVVYPFGVADIYSKPAICQNFNRLICKDKNNEKLIWDFNVGNIDALAEPVMTEKMVFQGTMEGFVYALNLTEVDESVYAIEMDDRNDKRIISWSFNADGAVNTSVVVHEGKVYFGSNNGTIYCLDELTGELQWFTKVESIEKRARKHFSTGVIGAGKLYMGSANKNLYCLDLNNGDILWQATTRDWVRSNPVLNDKGVFVADVSGRLYGFDKKGDLLFEKKVSTHPIYADLALSENRIVLNDSHLITYCFNLKGDQLWKHSILKANFRDDGERVFTDQLSGGTYYQSKPTAVDGMLYFGSPAGFLYGVDADTGQELWKFEMGGAISVAPAVMDGKVYAGQQGGERFYYCNDAKTGSLIWKQTLPGGWVWGSATVDDGLVYVPTVSGYAVCLDGKTGNIIWMYPTAKSIPAEPAIEGDIVYFGSWSRTLYAFNKKTGEVEWEMKAPSLDSGTLITDGDKLYLPSYKNIFAIYNSKTGELLSEGNKNRKLIEGIHNFQASPAFHKGLGFFTAKAGIGFSNPPLLSRVYCVDMETEKINWTYPDGGGVTAPALANGRVYIGSSNYPYLHALDQKTGKPYWIYKLGNLEEATLCIYRNKLYALSSDGYIHAIE
ncbi:PQQ-binding-like beta-propeller repeat protein [Aestuariivivens sediminis]|uniref:PQQ-binding-like beta-propeller repeat protein n=1 Tax=Aestuariivivens sediminis TaxID=2913557 RepID=UPI001F5A8F5E|nr:PQQ-binding-like beta-propeller repeat protein [Aestuariivivens sediminis]